MSDAEGCTVTVCRECCGNSAEQPQAEHDGQLQQLRNALTGSHRVRTSQCLDVCEQAVVVVVHPTPAARRAGARPVWLSLVGDTAIVDVLTEWVRDGGPGVAQLPTILEPSLIAPPAQQAGGRDAPVQ